MRAECEAELRCAIEDIVGFDGPAVILVLFVDDGLVLDEVAGRRAQDELTILIESNAIESMQVEFKL